MMKKCLFSAVLALALVLGLAAPAGVVMTAEAAVSLSDAQYYLDILNQTNPANSYLIDFDGDGRDELLTVSEKSYNVWQGEKVLASDYSLEDIYLIGTTDSWICTKGNKNYLRTSDVSNILGADYYYTVQNGQWICEQQIFALEDSTMQEYSVDGQKVSHEEYDRVMESYQIQFRLSPIEYAQSRNVRSELEAIVQTETMKNASPEEILAQIPYYGDRSKCRMTSEMATEYADIIDREMAELRQQYADLKPLEFLDDRTLELGAALIDDGSGFPILFFAGGASFGFGGETISKDNSFYWGEVGSNGLWYYDNGQIVNWLENDDFIPGTYSYNICNDYIYVVHAGGDVEIGYTVFPINNGRIATEPSTQLSWDGLRFNFSEHWYIDGKEVSKSQAEEWIKQWELKNGLAGHAYEGGVGGDVYGVGSAEKISSALRAYADAKKFPAYTYSQVEAGDAHYSDVAAAAAGQGTVQAVYKLLEDAYYVLLENQGSYTGALVRGLLENGQPVWRVTQTDPEPAAEDVLGQLVNRLVTKANLELDFSKLRGTPALEELTDYLRELLKNIDGLTPNDPAKGDMAAFLEGAVAALASGTASGKDNRLTVTEKAVSKLVTQARQAYDSLTGELRQAGVELNKSVTPKVRLLWGEIDAGKACQLTLDKDLAQALDGFDLQVLLGDGQTYLQFSAGNLQALTNELGQLSVQFQQEKDGVYAIRFLDGGGQVVEQLSRPVTVGLPAPGELATIIASYASGSDNWGGQYDPAAGAITFETAFSGSYEVLENNVDIDDIGALSEESQAAISFMVSRGYMSAEDGLFRPTDSLTRYEFTEALVGMFFALDRSLTTTFPDVPADSPYYAYVASAQARSIVTGYNNGTFGGEKTINREQAFALAARTLMDQKGYAAPSDGEAYLSAFEDRDQISSWAVEQVALSVREGIVDRSGQMEPLAEITREQAAVTLYRLFQLLYDVPPVALDMPEVSSAGLPTAVIIGGSVAVAAVAAGGAVVLLRKKPKTGKEGEA